MSENKIIKIKIQNYGHRGDFVRILAMEGHKVWVEEEKPSETDPTYYVCFVEVEK